MSPLSHVITRKLLPTLLLPHLPGLEPPPASTMLMSKQSGAGSATTQTEPGPPLVMCIEMLGKSVSLASDLLHEK